MAYIPPHLRVSDGKSRPRPEAPPPSRREPNSFARGNEKGLVPDVRINYSGDFISRFIVMSQEPLEFERFHGETFAHLDHKELYVLKTRDAKEDDNSTDQENVEKKVKESPSDLIAKTSGEDLKQVLEKFKSFIVMENADRIVPRVAIKFGKVIFHCRGGSLERSGGFLRNAIEAKDGRLRDLSKTFDNSVSEEKYSLLYNIAFRNAEKTWSRERYTVQVSDETNPGKQLLCVCMGAKSNEQLQHCSISSSGSCLKMIKVKFATVRYFICDMACVKKTSDIRFMLCTKNYCTGLNEEELEDLESCFSNVSLIPNVKGGLHWPAGSKQSRSGRFKVLGSTHSEKVVFVGRGLRWSLQKRNRIEFKASSGRVSYEVNIRPTSYDKFCQVDIDSLVWSDDIVPAPPSRDEEDDIYRMLHRELESVGTHVTRSRSRATTQRVSSSMTRLAPRGPRPRRARVMRGSSSRGRGLPTESDTLLDLELDLEDEEPLMPAELVALEFDDEGRVLESMDEDSSSSEDSDI